MNHRYPPTAALLCLALAIPLHAAPENDLFADSLQLEGTNITYVGDLSMATFEPDEPDASAPNTIWVSWAPPFTGRARYSHVTAPLPHYIALYTGDNLDTLESVRVVGMDNGRFDFLAIAGTTYHFQLAGGAGEFTLRIQTAPWETAPNDSFANAHRMLGHNVNYAIDPEWFTIGDATAEPGEPAHLNPLPFKSLWWQWTAPLHGDATFWAHRSLATNVQLAVYQGNSIQTLSLLASGTTSVSFPTTGGELYYIAAAVPPDAVGDVLIHGTVSGGSFTATRPVPGNLLREPSWEGTGIHGSQYWQMSGSIGGYTDGRRGADGRTWPVLSTGARVWQDFATEPGHEHTIRFAVQLGGALSGGSGNARVRVLWNEQEVGIVEISGNEAGFWHWAGVNATATSSTSRVTFENLDRPAEMDAFSVVSLNAPAVIVREPVSTSVFTGGSAALIVGAEGSLPLTYQWHFNDSPLPGETSGILLFDPVTAAHAGSYHAVVSNRFGMVTSATVTLQVENPDFPVILWQPHGDAVEEGGYHRFTVLAAGALPLQYQWYKDDEPISGATERMLTFNPALMTDAGSYFVHVGNPVGSVRSLTARLKVVDAIDGGGQINVRNRLASLGNPDAPVFDIDGITKLAGSNFVAQLYAGPSLEWLRPAGEPAPFLSGSGAGFFYPHIVTLPTVPPGSPAVVQVRVWEADMGGAYEEARSLGGRFGTSESLTVMTGGGIIPPGELEGLQSFSLRAGLPGFTVGRIEFLERQPGGIVVWSHQGEPGFRYVIEKSFRGFQWQPYLVITNLSHTATFTDSASSGSAVTFYRSRILD